MSAGITPNDPRCAREPIHPSRPASIEPCAPSSNRVMMMPTTRLAESGSVHTYFLRSDFIAASRHFAFVNAEGITPTAMFTLSR
jgi:hypothetical protein